MLREIAHLARHATEMFRLQRSMPQAEFYDAMITRADEEGYAEVRRELVADLRGRVLEVGCGTGAMFGYYDSAATVDAIEPEPSFLAIARAKTPRFGGRITARIGDGMALDVPSGSIDAVVLGLVLCSVPNVATVLAEVARVLRPGGSLRALEHVRSPRATSGRLMDVVDPVWLKLNQQGCHLNRRPAEAMIEAGFVIDDLREFQRFDTVIPAFPMQRIRAHKPA